MTIDKKCYLYGSCKCQTAGCVVRPDNGCPVYRYFKNIIVKDYETRLKTDMAAMLDELKEQLREMHEDFYETEHFDEAYGVSVSMDVIRQKINNLAEGSEKE